MKHSIEVPEPRHPLPAGRARPPATAILKGRLLDAFQSVLGLLVIVFVSSCATAPPKPNYEYTDKGLSLTSVPADARVDVTIQVTKRKNDIETGKPGLNQVSFVTPYFDPNDRFV